jgi:hypothetical protein
MAGKFYLQIERVQRAPIQGLAGLHEQPVPLAVREAVQMPQLHRGCSQAKRRAELRLQAARHCVK